MKTTTFETGISKAISKIISKGKTVCKGNAKKIFCRDYKASDYDTFEARLLLKLTLEKIIDYSEFQSIFLETLNNIAPIKMKIIRYNNSPFMNNSLRKSIITSQD